MTLQLKVQKFKFVPVKSLALVSNAVNVSMNEVIYDDTKSSKTYVTDGLATCVAIAFCGIDSGFTMAFTHMASATTETDDVRKEGILNQMLEYMLKTLPVEKVKMLISPSTVQETHIISFISSWASKKAIKCECLTKGADSAVFHINAKGDPLMLSALLNLKEQSNKKWGCHGIVQDTSNSELAATYYVKPRVSSFFKPLILKAETIGSGAALTA